MNQWNVSSKIIGIIDFSFWRIFTVWFVNQKNEKEFYFSGLERKFIILLNIFYHQI